jgi:anaerobic selenocysteine-containing dehydrogenase
VEGGVSANAWDKGAAAQNCRRTQSLERDDRPREYPLTFYELSILLPTFKEAAVDTYFTRLQSSMTNPMACRGWMLTDETKMGLHVCLTPTWSETAWFADYVLPMVTAQSATI